MKLKLYNTETRKKEEIEPLDGMAIRMYTCGPTVYNFAHIGNFRTYVFEDLLRRTLKFFGNKVIQAMNLTDVDDKTLRGAIEQGVSLSEFTKPYSDAFFEDLHTLKIEQVEHYPAATEYIPQMIALTKKLLEKGIAYQGTDGSIYYAIGRFPRYGRLSHLCLSELKVGASGHIHDEYEKENVSDFVLWKAYDPSRDGEIYWESPFGKGRPGWHIECSAMAMQLLGESIDIHVGGVDNIFPHHENEIAQSEGVTGKCFVAHWLHCEHLLVDHKKMSKSLGNFYTLRDLLKKGYSGEQIRYLLLQTHYRTQLNFTFEGLDAAGASLERLSAFIQRLRANDQKEGFGLINPLIQKTKELFKEALGDDLSISPALAVLFDFVREVNGLSDAGKVSSEEAKQILKFLEEIDQVLAVLPLHTMQEIPAELEEALKAREEARLKKNWALSDKWRDFIISKGYAIEDTPTGPRLKRDKR